ncbi:MAG: hypothetical protein U0Q18_27120 [Bryobacteraceae bacterium]
MRFQVLYQLAAADFLERVRRYSFLITLGLTAYFCFVCLPPNDASYVTLQMGRHRGVYNSAYVAALVAMQTALVISLAGFYLVKNAVDRDLQTGVGPILAATPLTKLQYTVGKVVSNFAVLAVMIAVMAVASGVMQLARGEDRTVRIAQLAAPFLLIALPVMAVVASVAVLFEVIPALRGGLGNVIYFFAWTAALGSVAASTSAISSGADPLAFGAVIPSIRSACETAFPGCATTQEFSMGFNFGAAGSWHLTTFRWEGLHWTPAMIVARMFWMGVAATVTLLAAARFHRFDPARERRKEENIRQENAQNRIERVQTTAPPVSLSALPEPARRFQFRSIIAAELRIALQGVSRWWYLVTLLLSIGGAASPVDIARFFLVAAWIWPILIWSAMGTREARQGTSQLVFSIAHPLRRQLPACWLAGVLVAVLTGLGPAVRFLLTGRTAGLAAWATGALFIPALALALGVWSGSSKLFEVLYTLLWYIGPANQIAELDYMGATPRPGATAAFFACAVFLCIVAVAGRRRQVRIYS